MGQDFSGSCTVTSRNPLILNGATKGTNSPRFDAEGVPPCRCRVLAAAPDGALVTVNFGEFFFPGTSVNRGGDENGRGVQSSLALSFGKACASS
jgi:hypothetical protein